MSTVLRVPLNCFTVEHEMNYLIPKKAKKTIHGIHLTTFLGLGV